MADRIIPLNPGPSATLGPSFPVDAAASARPPRDQPRREFKQLRRDVTQYLMQVGGRARMPPGEAQGHQPAVGSAQHRRANIRRSRTRARQRERSAARSATSATSSSRRSSRSIRRASGPIRGRRRLRPEDPQGRVRLDHRPLRLRQVDRAVDDGRPHRRSARACIVLDGREIATAGPDRGIVFQAPSLRALAHAPTRTSRSAWSRCSRTPTQARAPRHRRVLPRAASASPTRRTSAPPSSRTA